MLTSSESSHTPTRPLASPGSMLVTGLLTVFGSLGLLLLPFVAPVGNLLWEFPFPSWIDTALRVSIVAYALFLLVAPLIAIVVAAGSWWATHGTIQRVVFKTWIAIVLFSLVGWTGEMVSICGGNASPGEGIVLYFLGGVAAGETVAVVLTTGFVFLVRDFRSRPRT